MPEPIILICSRATVAFVAPGSVFDKKCSRCKVNVAMAPSGQRFYRERPDAVIVCAVCLKLADLEGRSQQFAAKSETIEREITGAVPNTWKEPLTRREKQVVDLRITGVARKEVAYRLGISEKTVSVHLHQAHRKLGVHNLKQLQEAIRSARFKVAYGLEFVVSPKEGVG